MRKLLRLLRLPARRKTVCVSCSVPECSASETVSNRRGRLSTPPSVDCASMAKRSIVICQARDGHETGEWPRYRDAVDEVWGGRK